MAQTRPLKLTLPQRDATAIDFCDGTPEGLSAWLAALPKTDPVRAAHGLFGGLVQLNRCHAPHAQRFAQLEILRPMVHLACSDVTRRRRTQSLLRRERERKEAALAQRLQYQLAIGYKMVIVDGLRSGVRLVPGADPASDTRVAVTAIHRTLTELAHTLLRSLQLYTPPPAKLWEQIHQLYYLAEVRGVLGEPVLDPEHQLRAETTLGDACERSMLLAAARPNMLRHADLGQLFAALEDWTRHVRIVPAATTSDPLLLVNINGDRPPSRAALYSSAADEDLRAIDAWDLVDRLNRFLVGENDGQALDLEHLDAAQESLIRHVVDAWGAAAERAHPRHPVSGTLTLCVGLASVHFHAGGERDLQQQMQSRLLGDDDASEEEEIFDPFAGSSDVGGANLHDREQQQRPRRPARNSVDQEALRAQHPLARFDLSDRSPGGYGLICNGEAPPGLQAGELIAVREDDDTDWGVAQVRWCANGPEQSRIGVALLAAHVETGGARSLTARGEDRSWTPVALLPGSEAIGEATVLLGPPGRFEPGTKIAFNQQGRESKLMIEQRLPHPDSFDRFEVRELGGESTLQDTGIEVDFISEEDEQAALAAFGFRTGSGD